MTETEYIDVKNLGHLTDAVQVLSNVFFMEGEDEEMEKEFNQSRFVIAKLRDKLQEQIEVNIES